MKCERVHGTAQERTDSSDKSSENINQVANHSVADFHTGTSDGQFLQLIEAKRPRVNFPSANSSEWQALDLELVTVIHKMTNFLS